MTPNQYINSVVQKHRLRYCSSATAIAERTGQTVGFIEDTLKELK